MFSHALGSGLIGKLVEFAKDRKCEVTRLLKIDMSDDFSNRLSYWLEYLRIRSDALWSISFRPAGIAEEEPLERCASLRFAP
jgi:hypothetical protein